MFFDPFSNEENERKQYMKINWFPWRHFTITLLFFALPAAVHAQFDFVTNSDDASITISQYIGPAGAVVIPNTINGYPVTGIGVAAFDVGLALTSITIPNSVTTVGTMAFANNGYLAGLTIPTNVTSIGDYAFANCGGLTSISIPGSVTNIGLDVFFDTSLTKISVDPANPSYRALNGVLFDKAQETLVDYPPALNGPYTIPNGVTSIRDDAFDHCRLTGITIPDGVTNIGVNAFNNDGLTNAIIPGSVTSIGAGAFQYCPLTSVAIPGSVTTMGDYAFADCTPVVSVTIASGATTIGRWAFNNCSSLASVTIPNSVTNIGESAFEGCRLLKNLTLPSGLTDIATRAFLATGLTNIVIPNSVTNIGDSAFFGCPMNSLTLSSNVTSIGPQAFVCSNLTSVIIPSSVTSIGVDAFEYCHQLTSAWFQGNAPPDNGTSFLNTPATIYYLPGTTGWGPTFGSRPAVLWNPHATTFTTASGQFGFNITGPTKATIVVIVCTNLTNPLWLPVSTNILPSSGTSQFSDPQSPNYPNRFYRFRAP
jgi:hypothetical protein